MKITYNINLDGRVFTIDEDAYRLLNEYLDTLAHAFENTEDQEIIPDIEARISEIFYLEQEEGKQVITLRDVENVITRIGHPEELVEDIEIKTNNETIEATERIHTGPIPPPIPQPVKIQKRLYRDSRNGLLGGVCAGIAEYLNMDVTWVRLIAVVLCFVSFSTLALVYLILWIILPNAVTPLQRMQLTGESPTLHNIGQNVKRYFKSDNPHNQQSNPLESQSEDQSGGKGFADNLAGFFGILAKVFLIFVLVICFPILIAIAIGLIGCLIGLVGAAIAGFTSVGFPGISSDELPFFTTSILCAIGILVVLGIPVYALIRLILKGDKSPMKPGYKIAMVITWILALVLFIVTAGILSLGINEAPAIVFNMPWW